MNAPQGSFAEASAPGRLDVMGGIADYSGSLVLQLPIHQRTSVTVTPRSDFRCTVQSKTRNERMEGAVDYREFLDNGKVNYGFSKLQFDRNAANRWMAYVLGCVLVLEKEMQIPFRGADFLIQSDIPLGKGVSSSAAIEVATLKALATLFGLRFQGTELPVLAQRAENLVVGAPCGLMDQLTSFFGKPNQLLPIRCQPDQVMAPITIPRDIFFPGVDSGVRHAVGGSSYSKVRCAAFMGYTLLAEAEGAKTRDILDAVAQNDFSRLPYRGYLCNVLPDEFDAKLKQLLPDKMSGKEFLSRFPRTIDSATTVVETETYAVRTCTAHPVFENERVKEFIDHIQAVNQSVDSALIDGHLQRMGQLMYASHASYSRCGLGTDETDEIVELARRRFSEGIFGARITGGGNGGIVCLLAVRDHGKAAVRDIHRQLQEKRNTPLELIDT